MLSKDFSRTTDDVAPHSFASFSSERILSTWGRARQDTDGICGLGRI